MDKAPENKMNKIKLKVRKPTPMQSEIYCLYCGKILNYLWTEDNLFASAGLGRYTYCRGCDTFFVVGSAQGTYETKLEFEELP